MSSKSKCRSNDVSRSDMDKVLSAFEELMEFDEDGYYIHDLEAVDRFEEFYVHRDENFDVVDCSFNSSLRGFCAALRKLSHGESLRLGRSNGLESKSFKQYAASPIMNRLSRQASPVSFL